MHSTNTCSTVVFTRSFCCMILWALETCLRNIMRINNTHNTTHNDFIIDTITSNWSKSDKREKAKFDNDSCYAFLTFFFLTYR